MVKVPILQHLESLRDEELEERREKRRQQLAEEEEAKQNERSASAGEENREQTLQVCVREKRVAWVTARGIDGTDSIYIVRCQNVSPPPFVF